MQTDAAEVAAENKFVAAVVASQRYRVILEISLRQSNCLVDDFRILDARQFEVNFLILGERTAKLFSNIAAGFYRHRRAGIFYHAVFNVRAVRDGNNVFAVVIPIAAAIAVKTADTVNRDSFSASSRSNQHAVFNIDIGNAANQTNHVVRAHTAHGD